MYLNSLRFPLILDGGLSNVLESKGCDLNHKLWTAELLISNPQAIIETHIEYLKAGAQIISTIGYQASIQGLRDLGFEQAYIQELILKPVELAAEAINQFKHNEFKPLIAASIGPYGAYLGDGSEYRGNYGLSDIELKYFHEERIDLLADSSSDILAFETIPSYQEAVVIADLVKHKQKESWISFSCKDGVHINDGTLLAKACELIEPVEKIFAIGVNCTAPNHISSLISIIKQHAPSKKVIIYPNSGEVFNAVDKTWKGINNASDFANQALKWVNEGADIIGGCCRIGPNHIEQIATNLATQSS